MAAQVMQSQGMGTETEGMCPRLWSSAVFFEKYMLDGAHGTVDEFGPKEPIQINIVKKNDA